MKNVQDIDVSHLYALSPFKDTNDCIFCFLG